MRKLEEIEEPEILILFASYDLKESQQQIVTMIVLVFTALAGLLITVCVYWYVFHTRLMQSETKIPFLGGHLPLIGHMHRLINWNDFYGRQMADYYQQHGDTVGVYFAQKRFVFTRDLDVIEDLMRSPTLIDKPWTYRIIERMVGESVFTTTGDLWKKRRRLLTPAFHFDILKGFLEVMEERSLELVEIFGKLADDSQQTPFDAFKYSGPLTLSVLCQTSMGVDYTVQNMLEGLKFESLFKGMNTHFINKVMYPWYRNDFIYSLSKDGASCKQDIKAIHDLMHEIIEKRVEFRKSLEDENVKKNSDDSGCSALLPLKSRRIFIDTMLDSFQQGEIDVEGIVTEVNTFIIAGYDTTATTLSWALYLLGRNKDKQQKLCDEFNASGLVPPLTMEALSQLRYLECVIKETQRLMPGVTRLGRRIPAGTTLGGKVFPDCNISVDILAMNRNPIVWKDPMLYVPERFTRPGVSDSASVSSSTTASVTTEQTEGKGVAEKGEISMAGKTKDHLSEGTNSNKSSSSKSNAYRYIPFSAGPRNCIGQRFAMNELRVSLFHIISNFELTAIHSIDELEEDFSLFHKSFNGLMLTIKRR